MTPDVAASVRARLLRKAKERGEEFELFLVRYAVESFLYRLGASPWRVRCVLKGAALLTLWMEDPYRSSRDVDLLATGPGDEAGIRALVTEVCALPCPEDGLRFDVDTLAVAPIHDDDGTGGQRAVLIAYLGKARMRVQIDCGFGDAVSPAPEESEYPTLLDTLPAPAVRTYPRVVSIAEKFDAMVTLGRRNSRMKDFHDVWALSGAFSFRGAILREAIDTCFARRGTRWTAEIPDSLTPSFYQDDALRARWSAYLRTGALRVVPPARFEEIGERVREFLLPVRESIVGDARFEVSWAPGGPWE